MQVRSMFVTVLSVGALALMGAAVLPACSSTSDPPAAAAGDDAGPAAVVDSSIPKTFCTPGTRSCKSATVAQACAADGSAFAEEPCGAAERCTGGICISSANPNVCQDATTALRHLPNGTYEVVKCPAGTACIGAGLCKGAFVVGSSECLGIQSVATSADGLTQTATACPAGQLCVVTSDQNGGTAACKASECTPSQPNLAFCGNPKNPTANVGKAVSKCVATPEGYKFVTTLCPDPASCIPGTKPVNNNNNPKPPTDATCGTSCVPGSSRCTGNGISTCAADGTWGLPTSCAPGSACMASPADPSKALCGDPACVRNGGACDGSNYRACTATGTLGPAAPCASGTCVATGVGGGGLCLTECSAGEERCASANSTAYQTCVNGRWSATATSCAAGGKCLTYTAANGKSAKLCGADCAPGTMRCSLTDGGPGGDGATQTCDATGKWGAAAACAIGRCATNGTAAACVAECVPGSLVCAGNNNGVPGTPYAGRSGFQSCSAKGLLDPTVTGCAANTFCRSKNGRALVPAGATNACIACVGSNIAGGNEDGLVDSRCSTAAGDAPGNNASQICAADNTWTAGLTACANGCTGPAPHSGPTVPICSTTGNGDFMTESYYAAHRRGSCSNSRRARGSSPVVCGVVPDCCSSLCQHPIPATPASCNGP